MPPLIPPLVGRLPELDAMRARLIAATQGHGGIVALSGEPGIGKSRLAREVATLARKHQFTIARTRLFEGHWQPEWQCWIELVDQVLPGLYPAPANQHRPVPAWAVPLAPLCASVAARFPGAGGSPGSDREREHERRFHVRHAFTACLAHCAERQPLLIVIDDVQWAEPESLQLLPYLAVVASTSRMLIVLPLRDNQPSANGDLAAMLGRLHREDNVQEIRLRGLDRPLVGQLIASVAHRPVSETMVNLIADASRGNPFFIQELTRYLLDENLIDVSGSPTDQQQWLQHLRLPESLQQVIGRRVSDLSADSAEMLHLASICTDGFDDVMLAALTGFDESRLLDAIDEALDHQLIAPLPDQPERYNFVDTLILHVLSASWGPSRRIRLHRRLAEALVSRASPHHAGEIAFHYHVSASLPGAENGIPFAIAAAARAWKDDDTERVVTWYRMARDLSQARPPAERAHILTVLAIAEADAFHLDEALRTIEDALDALDEANAPHGQRAAMIASTVTALHDAGMHSEAWMPMLNYGLELTPATDRETWARLTLLIDRFEIIVDGVITGSRWLGSNEEAVTIARTCGDENLYARSLQPWDLWERAWTEDLSVRIRTWHKPSAIIRGLTVTGADWLYHQGDLRRAMSEFEDLRDIAARHHDTPGQAEASVRLALIQTAFGNLDVAAHLESEARSFVSRLGEGHRLHASLWWIGALRAEYQRGDWEPIAAWFLNYVADPDSARGTIALDDAALAALALIRTSRVDTARQLLTTLGGVLERTEPTLWLLNGSVGFGAAAVWELRAADLAPAFLASATTLIDTGFGDFPGSSLHLAGARMATLLGEADRADHAFDHARAHLDASGQAPQRALVEFDQALALHDFARHDPDRAIVLLHNAIARFRKLGMECWFDRAQVLVNDWTGRQTRSAFDPGTLSTREAEVLQLIARGLSDRQISERIFVSPRTVNAHIRNMLAKTHTSNRTELTMWALEHHVVIRPPAPEN
jgi:DNA-binding CsgD family transcriptional regulator